MKMLRGEKFFGFTYLKPYTKTLILCLIFMLLFAMVSTLSLSLLSPFLQAIFYQHKFTTSNDFLAKISEWFLGGSKAQAFIRLQLVLVGAFLIKGILGYMHEYLGVSIEEKVMKKVRDDTFSHIHSLSLAYFQRTRSGNIVSRITNDISMLKGAIKDGLLKFIEYLLLTIAYFSFALYLSWQLLLVTLITFPVLAWLINTLSKKLREKSERVQEDMAKTTAILNESISGIKIIKAFVAHEFEVRKFMNSTYNYLKSAIRFERIGLMGVPISEFIVAVGACILLSYGGYLIFITRTISPDKFMVFLACAISMMQSLKQLPKANVGVQKAIQAMSRVKRVLEIEPTVKEIETPIPLKSFSHEIKFNNVHFSYDHSKEVICGVNFVIRKGESVALVGPSGAGKSTLTDLLARFYDPTHGTIEIDDVDIKQVSLKDLRALIGLVTQEPILFNDTVANNIAYGDTNPSQELVIKAAKLANAHEFIERLPQTYNTVIGERGTLLSGGERQRIAIARTLYKNPPILIFDEATSNLDQESETKIRIAMKNLLKDRTSIIIAHRLSTVRACDRIIVVENGKIVEQGTHEELIKTKGVYQRLVSQELILQDTNWGRGGNE